MHTMTSIEEHILDCRMDAYERGKMRTIPQEIIYQYTMERLTRHDPTNLEALLRSHE